MKKIFLMLGLLIITSLLMIGCVNTANLRDDSGALAGQAIARCVPSCESKSCGNDGCRGSCGSCLKNQTCTNGQCVNTCVSLNESMLCSVNKLECGIKVVNNSCGKLQKLYCGSCSNGKICSSTNKCVSTNSTNTTICVSKSPTCSETGIRCPGNLVSPKLYCGKGKTCDTLSGQCVNSTSICGNGICEEGEGPLGHEIGASFGCLEDCKCTDTDGFNLTKKGNAIGYWWNNQGVDYAWHSATDECVSNLSKISEAYCDSKSYLVKGTVDCPIGMTCSDGNCIAVSELSCSKVVADEEYFKLGNTTFQYKGADDLADTNPEVMFKNILTGETILSPAKETVIIHYGIYGLTLVNPKIDDSDMVLSYPCGFETSCGSIIAKEGNFTMNGTIWQYKGADDFINTSAKMRLKNLYTGETIDFPQSKKSLFSINHLNVNYYFENVNNYLWDDYTITLVSPCK